MASRPEHGGRIAAMLAAMDELSAGLDDLANTLHTMEQYDGLLEQLKTLKYQASGGSPVRTQKARPVPPPAGPVRPVGKTADPARPAAWTGSKHDAGPSATACIETPPHTTKGKPAYMEAGLTLVRAMDKKAVSVPVLAKRSGMSATTLRKLLQGDATVTVPFYYKAAIELGCLRRVQELLPENRTADGPNTKGGNGSLG